MSGIKHFSGFEVIRAAKEVEKNGHRFYSTMSERATDAALKDLFAWLAQDEVEHLRRLHQLEAKYQEGSFADYEEEFLPYLKRFSDDRIFPEYIGDFIENITECPFPVIEQNNQPMSLFPELAALSERTGKRKFEVMNALRSKPV